MPAAALGAKLFPVVLYKHHLSLLSPSIGPLTHSAYFIFELVLSTYVD